MATHVSGDVLNSRKLQVLIGAYQTSNDAGDKFICSVLKSARDGQFRSVVDIEDEDDYDIIDACDYLGFAHNYLRMFERVKNKYLKLSHALALATAEVSMLSPTRDDELVAKLEANADAIKELAITTRGMIVLQTYRIVRHFNGPSASSRRFDPNASRHAPMDESDIREIFFQCDESSISTSECNHVDAVGGNDIWGGESE